MSNYRAGSVATTSRGWLRGGTTSSSPRRIPRAAPVPVRGRAWAGAESGWGTSFLPLSLGRHGSGLQEALSARQNDGFETLASSLPPLRETLRRRPVMEHLVVHLVSTAHGVPNCPCSGAVRHLPHPSRLRGLLVVVTSCARFPSPSQGKHLASRESLDIRPNGPNRLTPFRRLGDVQIRGPRHHAVGTLGPGDHRLNVRGRQRRRPSTRSRVSG